MSRRLADLESLLLATQVRERTGEPPPSIPTALPIVSSMQTERKVAVSYGNNTTFKKEQGGRSSGEDSTEDDVPSPPGADHSLIDVNNETHGVEYYGGSSSVAVLASPDGVPTNEPVSSRLIEGGFLNAFFDTLHYMHPVVDKKAFLERCDKGAVESESDFAALYYACLAIAAITSPEKDPKLTGYSPIQWANMYVDRAKKCIPLAKKC